MAEPDRASRRSTRRLRCAIYTRKSSEEGLEQAFNSLDAQREACAAFILSQKHEGWTGLPALYDDGGFSGGTMDRPALKRLLGDIGAGKVDVVVVYKIDRLTRSLFDFAKIVEAFDARGVSFVSITQQFNTTTSMGRLTLNVLLSFAQCFQEERHVDGGSLQAELDGAGIRSKRRMWRVQEEQGIELMLMLNDMTRADVEVVDFPYPDDWYDKPEMLAPMENPSELWLKRDHKHDLAFRPLEMALLDGTVDAIYTQTGPFQHIQEQTGKIKAIENLANYPDWTLQGANVPATCTVSDVACKEHPEVVVALLKGLIKVGRWSNEHKHAAAAILDKQTYYLDVEDTYRNILNVDMVPKLSPYNLEALRINKDFMLNHGYIENDFDVYEWAAPEFVEKAAAELLEEEWKKRSMDKLPEATSLNDAMTARLG